MSNVQQENCSLERGPGVDSFELLPSQKDPKGKNVICVICLLISLQVFLVSFEGCIYVGYIYIYTRLFPQCHQFRIWSANAGTTWMGGYLVRLVKGLVVDN